MNRILHTLLCVAIATATMAQVTTNGLQAQYTFNGNLNDTSGSSRHLSNVGNAAALVYVAGHDTINQGVDLYDGANCAVLQSTNTFSFNDSSITISFWGNFLQPAGTTGYFSNNVIVVKESGTGLKSYMLEHQRVGTLHYLIFHAYYDATLTNKRTASINITPYVNEWHQYTLVFNKANTAAGIAIYRDGLSAATSSVSATSTINAGANQISIGEASVSCVQYSLLDETLIYDRALTDTEIARIYVAQYTGPCRHIISGSFAQAGTTFTGCNSGGGFAMQPSVTNSSGAGLTYQWYKDGAAIPGETAYRYLYQRNPSFNGAYSVVVSTICDTVTYGDFIINITQRPAQPSITANGNQLTASVMGNTYDWYLDGNLITGANTQTITATTNGDYTVAVVDGPLGNGCASLISAVYAYSGASSCNNTISIFGGALSGQFCESASLTLNMQPTINAGTNLSYQWFKDGTLIPGATNLRYEFQSLVANSGTYSIKVTSNCDTVTYGNLLVDILPRNARPTITANGSTLTSSTAGNSYQWFLDGVLLTDNTQSITATADGNYRVIATGTCPSDTSAPFNYVANRVCSFNTTYTIGAGNCTTVTFDVDGAILPVTAFISYAGQQTPATHIFDSVVNTLADFCPSTYLVTLSDANGCTDTLTFTVLEVGISEVNQNISINLYPNPASQTLAISTSETLTGVEVYNLMGQRVFSQAGDVKQLVIGHLPAGTYYLNISTTNGSARKPFVKL